MKKLLLLVCLLIGAAITKAQDSLGTTHTIDMTGAIYQQRNAPPPEQFKIVDSLRLPIKVNYKTVDIQSLISPLFFFASEFTFGGTNFTEYQKVIQSWYHKFPTDTTLLEDNLSVEFGFFQELNSQQGGNLSAEEAVSSITDAGYRPLTYLEIVTLISQCGKYLPTKTNLPALGSVTVINTVQGNYYPHFECYAGAKYNRYMVFIYNYTENQQNFINYNGEDYCCNYCWIPVVKLQVP